MRVYIMTDMEGVAGVTDSENHSGPGARYYELARQLTTGETNAAIEGALAAGAKDILVVDGHGHGAIDPVLLHPAAHLMIGRPMGYPFGCDRTFDAAFIVGQHAKSNTDGGHLSHTGSMVVDELTINGVSMGELGENMLFCAYYGVPTVLVTGDQACCDEARALIPQMETVAVKEGLKRGPATGLTAAQNRLHNGCAIHLHPERARSLIREAARRALQRRSEIPRYWLEPPYELVVTLRRSEDAPRKIGRARADDLMALLTKPRNYEPIEAQA